MRLSMQTKPEPGIDAAIDSVLFEMRGYTADSKEYAAMVDQLVKLHALKVNETKKGVSPDTWATVAANILGIVLIVNYERVHVITSKALSFVLKTR